MATPQKYPCPYGPEMCPSCLHCECGYPDSEKSGEPIYETGLPPGYLCACPEVAGNHEPGANGGPGPKGSGRCRRSSAWILSEPMSVERYEEMAGRLRMRIAELENDVKVALRHYGGEMLKTHALGARVKELEAQVARWETKEIERAECCMQNEMRVKKLLAERDSLLKFLDDRDAILAWKIRAGDFRAKPTPSGENER